MLATLTLVHVILSLIGILAGLIVLLGFLTAKQFNAWTGIFIWTTVATSVTGFLFPFHKLLPSHIIGVLSLVALTVAIYALDGKHLAGAWRRVYAVNAMIALYFNVFVLIAQLFDKVPVLKVLAPTKTERPFAATQGVTLAVFIFLTVLATLRFGRTTEAKQAAPASVPAS